MQPETRRPPRMLISYHYFRDVDLDREVGKLPVRPILFADSGAFSSETLGVPIRIEEYAAWVHRWKHHFAVVANLDVIGCAEGSYRNLKHLERLGVRAMPVYHTGEPWEFFDRYVREYPYIALGGAVGFPPAKLMPWGIECFRRRNRLGSSCQFHGFGQTSSAAILGLPWFSCDSSSWVAGSKFGRVPLFDPIAGRTETLALFDRASVSKLSPLIRRYGGDPSVFADRARYHSNYAMAIGARSYRAMESWLRRRHGEIPLEGNPPGFHLYLAGTTGEIFGNRGQSVNAALGTDKPLHECVVYSAKAAARLKGAA